MYFSSVKLNQSIDSSSSSILKSGTNQEKHGIDFAEAQQLWQDTMRVEVPARWISPAVIWPQRENVQGSR
jgi:hypothetical protein